MFKYSVLLVIQKEDSSEYLDLRFGENRLDNLNLLPFFYKCNIFLVWFSFFLPEFVVFSVTD